MKSHFQFDNFDHINSVSLLSSCLVFRIKELKFINFPLKITLNSENIQTLQDRVTTVLLESKIESEVTIGSFITMLPDSDSGIQAAILFSDDDDIICTLSSVNISLFDTKITTYVQIQEEEIQFYSSFHLFHLGQTDVIGISTTDRPWESLQFNLKVTFTNDVIDSLTNYLNTDLRREIEDAVQHVNRANDTLKSSSIQVINLRKKLRRLHNELNDIEASLDAKRRNKSNLEEDNKLKQQETILYHLLETYWNGTDELSRLIKNVCRIEECKGTCKSGIVVTACYVPVEMVARIPCNIYEKVTGEVHKMTTVENTICSYGKAPSNPTSEILKLGLSFALKYYEVPQPYSEIIKYVGTKVINKLFPKKEVPCQPIKVYDNEWVTMKHLVLTVRNQVCDKLSVKEYDKKNCNHTEPCAVYEIDPICYAKNEECYRNRTQIIKKFNQGNGVKHKQLLENIDMRHDEYSQTLSDLVFLSSEIAVLKLSNISKKEEFEATNLKINSAQKSERVANKSYQSIKASNEKILSFRNALQDSTNSIIKIIDVSFDVTLETQTPVIVPLNVIYEITSSRTTHEVRIVVDISATDNLVKKTIYDNIYDDIIDNVIGGSLRKRRNVASSVLLTDIFKDNCDLQRSIINYLEQLNLSLSAVQNDIFDSISTVNSTRENENSNYEATVEALRSIGTNLSLSLLVNEGMIYASQMEAFDLVSSEIADTKISQWKADLDELHNETSNLFGQTCYSLFDCLSTSVTNIRKLIAPLAIFNNSEMALKLENAQLTVQELSINTNWTLDDMQYTISNVYSLAIEVDEDSYWCASSPVLINQPPVNVDEFVGQSLSFNCPSSSLLPVTYSWYKNRKPIPFATTSSLSIPYLTRADAGLYECEVKNAIGVTKSKPTVLRVYKKPTFTQEPDSITVINNDRNDAYFICQANAYPLPNYQWSYRKDNYSKWKDLYGETEGLLSISNVSDSNEGQYRCRAGNANSTIQSRPVTLTVLPGTFVRMSYNFTITINNVDNSSSLIQSLKNSFITAVADLIDVNLTPAQIMSAILTNYQLKISFVLLSSNYFILSETNSNEVWLSETLQDLGHLQASKGTLESAFHDRSTGNFLTLKVGSNNYLIGDNRVSPLMFDCPSGYQFDVSQFVCGKCDILHKC